MFKISPATGENILWARKYLEYEAMGMIMVLYEDDVKTGAVCFDIQNSAGLLQKVKVDNPAMKMVTAKAAMNFLELSRIYDLYIESEEFSQNENFYKMLGFKEKDGQGYINLEGYFDAKHEKGCC